MKRMVVLALLGVLICGFDPGPGPKLAFDPGPGPASIVKLSFNPGPGPMSIGEIDEVTG